MIENEMDFNDWLDGQLRNDLPDGIIAFAINIYESPFHIEIVGSNEFSINDEDWPCNEDWVPENRSVHVSRSVFGNSWENALENILAMARQHLQTKSKYAHKIKTAKAFAVGFVDGNLNYVR